MIAQLSGRVAAVAPDAIVLDVSGVGYRVLVPSTVLDRVMVDDELILHTHLHVRESELTLYGARDPQTLSLFVDLLSVNGVGPRAALSMLSSFDADSLADAIVHEDIDALTRVKGIGKKTAQRVVLDLRPRLETALGVALEGAGRGGSPVLGATGDELDAMAALTALGYTPAEARRALSVASIEADATVAERVTAALRALGGGS